MILNPKESQEFFSAVQLGNIKEINRILNGRPLKSLLNDIKPDQISSLPKKLTYGEIAITKAVYRDQLAMTAHLITEGCVLDEKHLRFFLSYLRKTQKDGNTRDVDIPKLLNKLIDNGVDINVMLADAVKADDEETVRHIAESNWRSLDRYKTTTSQDLVQFAVKSGALKVLMFLFSKENMKKTKVICLREKESLLSLARELENKEIVNFLDSQLKYEKNNTVNVLENPILPLELSDFVSGDELHPKGLALLLNYYHNKKMSTHVDPKVYFALGYDELARVIDLFIKSSESSLTLLFAYTGYNNEMGGHRSTYRLEKFQDKYYIILMDSYNTENDTFFSVKLRDAIRTNLSEHIPKIVLCQNTTNQQTDVTSCSHFALKNISKLLSTTSLAEEIESKHTLQRDSTDGISTIIYRLPARFMSTAQSYDRIQNYIKSNRSEDLKKVRVDKNGVTENLEEYIFHKRNKYGVITPEVRANRNYSAEDSSSHEPAFIKQNKSILYFASKHKDYVVPLLFNQSSQEELRSIVKNRDASNLTVDPITKKLEIQEQETTKVDVEEEKYSGYWF